MLRKFAVALLAASVFTAPVFAQGNGASTTPPAKTEIKKDSAAPKVVNAKPALKNAKIKTSKRYARHHAKHVTHVAHVKRAKHVKSAYTVHGTKGTQVRHVVAKATNGTNGTNGAMTGPKAKTNVN